MNKNVSLLTIVLLATLVLINGCASKSKHSTEYPDESYTTVKEEAQRDCYAELITRPSSFNTKIKAKFTWKIVYDVYKVYKDPKRVFQKKEYKNIPAQNTPAILLVSYPNNRKKEYTHTDNLGYVQLNLSEYISQSFEEIDTDSLKVKLKILPQESKQSPLNCFVEHTISFSELQEIYENLGHIEK